MQELQKVAQLVGSIANTTGPKDAEVGLSIAQFLLLAFSIFFYSVLFAKYRVTYVNIANDGILWI